LLELKTGSSYSPTPVNPNAARARVHTHTRTRTHAHTHAHARTHTRTRTHTHTRTRTHTRTHTHESFPTRFSYFLLPALTESGANRAGVLSALLSSQVITSKLLASWFAVLKKSGLLGGHTSLFCLLAAQCLSSELTARPN
jgi:hypothetical protein